MSLPGHRSSHRALAHALAAVAVALIAASVASCSSATAPATPSRTLSVTLASSSAPAYSADAQGRQLVACDATFQAHNTGTDTETWIDAVFVFYTPNDTITPITQQIVPTTDVQQAWGKQYLGAGATEVSSWHLTASVPFLVKTHFHVSLPTQGQDSSTVRLACEPPKTSGPPPTITAFEITGDTAREPSDTLHLWYTVTSSVGLWESTIQFTGPCTLTRQYPENRSRAITRTIDLPLPPSCTLGTPATVTASAVDAGNQTTTTSFTLPALVDDRPPRIKVAIGVEGVAAAADSFSWYAFVGDTVAVSATVDDNHLIHGIYWAVDPVAYRDSLLVGGPTADPWTQLIPIPASWVGSVSMWGYATDESGNVSDTVATASGALEVDSTLALAPTTEVIPGGAIDAAFDQKRGVLYVLQSHPDDIAVFSLTTHTVLQTLALPDYVPAFDLTQSGDSIVLVLRNHAKLGIVDLTASTLALDTVSLPGVDSTQELLNVKVASTGTALITTYYPPTNLGRIYGYDLTTGAGSFRTDAPPIGAPIWTRLERSGDGTMMVVNGATNGFARYDALTDAFETPQAARSDTAPPAIDATGATVVAGGDVYDGSLQYVRSFRVAVRQAGPSALSPDGSTDYMAIAGGIVRSRVSDGRIMDRIRVGGIPIEVLRISPDGTALVAVANYGDQAGICLIDLTRL